MMRIQFRSITLSLICCLAFSVSAYAVPVSGLKVFAQELVEIMLKKGGSRAAQELAEWGGEKAVRELAEEAMRTGGEKTVQILRQHVAAHGFSALKALKTNPGQMLQVLDEIPKSMVGKVLAAVNHNPVAMNRILSNYGSDALLVAAKHPGIGADICEGLGSQGIRAALRLESPQLIQLHRLLPQLNKLAASQRSQVLDMLSEAPARVLSFLEKHPRILLTSAGVTLLINYREAIMGGDEIIENPDGTKQVISKPGFLGRTTEKIISHPTFTHAVMLLSGFIGIALLIRFAGVPMVRILRLHTRQKRIQQS
jgi:hypothetical protein